MPANHLIQALAQRVQDLKPKQALGQAINDNSEIAEDLNIEQLTQGIRSDGSVITPAYTSTYKAYKASIGLDVSVVNLQLEGDFVEGITANVIGDVLVMAGTDSKTGQLRGKYGREIIGLTEESTKELLEEVKPDVLENMRGQIKHK